MWRRCRNFRKEEDALRAGYAKNQSFAKYGDAWFRHKPCTQAVPAEQTECLCDGSPSKMLIWRCILSGIPVRIKETQMQSGWRFRENRLPTLRREMLSSAPLYADLENRSCGLDDRYRAHLECRSVRANCCPDRLRQVAAQAGQWNLRLGDPRSPQSTFEVDRRKSASTDLLLCFRARSDPLLRKVRDAGNSKCNRWKTSREPRSRKRVLVYGNDIYPDATYTLRPAGEVKGYMKDTRPVPHQTLFYGLPGAIP